MRDIVTESLASKPRFALEYRLESAVYWAERVAASRALVVAIFTVLFVVPTVFLCRFKLFWDDEFFTLYPLPCPDIRLEGLASGSGHGGRSTSPKLLLSHSLDHRNTRDRSRHPETDGRLWVLAHVCLLVRDCEIPDNAYVGNRRHAFSPDNEPVLLRNRGPGIRARYRICRTGSPLLAQSDIIPAAADLSSLTRVQSRGRRCKPLLRSRGSHLPGFWRVCANDLPEKGRLAYLDCVRLHRAARHPVFPNPSECERLFQPLLGISGVVGRPVFLSK